MISASRPPSRREQRQGRDGLAGRRLFGDGAEDGARPPGAAAPAGTRGSSNGTAGCHCGAPDPADLSVTADAHPAPLPS